MAYDYVAGSFQGHYITPVSLSYPFTFACWFNGDLIGGVDTLLAYTDFDAAGLTGDLLGIFDAGGGNYQIAAGTYVSAASSFALSTTFFALNAWHHACAVFNSSTDRRAFLDGGGKGTNTVSRSPTGQDILGLAWAWFNSTVALGYDGEIAEIAIWDVALSDDEIAQLGKAISPLLVRPSNLAFYSPMIRELRDYIASVAWTGFNGPTVSAHPRVIRPNSPHVGAAGGVTHDVSAADIIKLSDTSSGSLIIQGSSSDVVELSDISAGSLTIAVIAADGMDFSDAPAAEGILSLSAADGIDLSDALIAERILSLSVTDGIKLTDSSAGIFNFSVNVADGLVMSDVISTMLNLLVSVSDGLKLSDIATDVSFLENGKMVMTISSKSAKIRFESKIPEIIMSGEKPRVKFKGV